MLKNLKAALDANRIPITLFAYFLGTTEKTARNKLNGKTCFRYHEAVIISKLFPEYEIEYLFKKDNDAA